jgi:hypothetical protein
MRTGRDEPAADLRRSGLFVRNHRVQRDLGAVRSRAITGIFYFNNTYVGEFRMLTPASNLHLRNNLILGQGTNPRALAIDTFTNYSSSDYNGFRVNPGAAASFAWNSPPFDVVRDYYPQRKAVDTTTVPVSQMASGPTYAPTLAPGQGRPLTQAQAVPLVQRSFATLKEYARVTGQDRHSVLLDYDVFVNAPMPDYSDPTHVVQPESVELQLKPRSKAVDAGLVLPNITDGYTGKAPDLGAYEVGQPLPHYGPRY